MNCPAAHRKRQRCPVLAAKLDRRRSRGGMRATRPCGGGQHHPGGLDRLRRPGAGAAANALSVNNGPIKLVAMADIFEDKLAAQL